MEQQNSEGGNQCKTNRFLLLFWREEQVAKTSTSGGSGWFVHTNQQQQQYNHYKWWHQRSLLPCRTGRIMAPASYSWDMAESRTCCPVKRETATTRSLESMMIVQTHSRIQCPGSIDSRSKRARVTRREPFIFGLIFNFSINDDDDDVLEHGTAIIMARTCSFSRLEWNKRNTTFAPSFSKLQNFSKKVFNLKFNQYNSRYKSGGGKQSPMIDPIEQEWRGAGVMEWLIQAMSMNALSPIHCLSPIHWVEQKTHNK